MVQIQRMRRTQEGTLIVSPSRYLSHHKRVADDIEQLLRQFGNSGDTPGFWCIKGAYTGFNTCIHCEHDNYCHPNPPPLSRRYKVDSKGIDRYLGDMMLDFIMHDKGVDDYVWLQHPETRRASI